jgi:hypothetical protein
LGAADVSELSEQLSPQQQSEREELARAFREVFALASGKRVLFWLLEQCAIYQDAYTGDNDATNYTLGRQSVGRKTIAMLDDLDPRFYPMLLLASADLKAMDRAAAEKRADKQEGDDDDQAP